MSRTISGSTPDIVIRPTEPDDGSLMVGDDPTLTWCDHPELGQVWALVYLDQDGQTCHLIPGGQNEVKLALQEAREWLEAVDLVLR